MKTKIIFIFILFCFSCNLKRKEIINKKNVKKESLNAQKDTVLIEIYPNKKIKYLIIRKDSLKSKELHLSFYENGNLKEKGLQGVISNEDVNTNMSIETWFYYDSSKNLDSTIYYNNASFGKDYIEKKRFYKNGIVKVIERYNNYVLYENEIDSIGIWVHYNEKGNLIKKIEFSK